MGLRKGTKMRGGHGWEGKGRLTPVDILKAIEGELVLRVMVRVTHNNFII